MNKTIHQKREEHQYAAKTFPIHAHHTADRGGRQDHPFKGYHLKAFNQGNMKELLVLPEISFSITLVQRQLGNAA